LSSGFVSGTAMALVGRTGVLEFGGHVTFYVSASRETRLNPSIATSLIF
jgi:hypothetical protein